MLTVPADRPIVRPIFIVSSPRSGSSLFFQTMMKARGAFTIGGESHQLIESLPALHPAQRQWHSNQLNAEDATPEIAAELRRRFYAALRDREGRPPSGPVRMIEKTPKNSLRIGFFDRIFPDASFLYLYRDPRETVSSMMEAWNSGRFRTYPRLPDWPGTPWSLLLVPGWRDLAGKPLAEIVAHQWANVMTGLLDSLDALDPNRVLALSYRDFLAAPDAMLSATCDRLGFGWDRPTGGTLPLSPTVVSAPDPDKWKRNAEEIETVWPIIEPVDTRAKAALERFR